MRIISIFESMTTDTTPLCVSCWPLQHYRLSPPSRRRPKSEYATGSIATRLGCNIGQLWLRSGKWFWLSFAYPFMKSWLSMCSDRYLFFVNLKQFKYKQDFINFHLTQPRCDRYWSTMGQMSMWSTRWRVRPYTWQLRTVIIRYIVFELPCRG